MDPLQRLSLQLQRTDATLADIHDWAAAAIQVLEDCKSRYKHSPLHTILFEFYFLQFFFTSYLRPDGLHSDSRKSENLTILLETGKFQGIEMKGRRPELAYKERLVCDLIKAINSRFSLEDSPMIAATRIGALRNWPPSDSSAIEGVFGMAEIFPLCLVLLSSLLIPLDV